MRKTIDIERLSAEIAACRLCRDHPAKGPDDRLPHKPNPVAVLSSTARILIAGQAPGIRVHDSGIPFNDPSGDRLRNWLGVDRETFYDPAKFSVVPMGFCFPGYDAKGGDKPPRRECAPQWRQTVMDAMPQIELILAIGQYAQAWHMPSERRANLTETVRDWRAIFEGSSRPQVLPLPHPSWRNSGWLKKNPWFETELLPVLREKVFLLTH
ncbi:uracil-DNA glycosylase family protein [Rhizobium sp. NRK18]|uniref:uracil-DNA glycosylase family protein n=1 Tax=Rhizobium sp. NRK18 TaxID=2964667 RepID=UPI0021C3420F|nr:uracil-DNA glycosylase family protein [Rhizobium sp. NRK18]MCQ2004015.1 uracil-DNA glycosylase family protein [Rhizobium sp. NRK18]